MGKTATEGPLESIIRKSRTWLLAGACCLALYGCDERQTLDERRQMVDHAEAFELPLPSDHESTVSMTAPNNYTMILAYRSVDGNEYVQPYTVYSVSTPVRLVSVGTRFKLVKPTKLTPEKEPEVRHDK